jgi:DMSO reductase anchor subunit
MVDPKVRSLLRFDRCVMGREGVFGEAFKAAVGGAQNLHGVFL